MSQMLEQNNRMNASFGSFGKPSGGKLAVIIQNSNRPKTLSRENRWSLIELAKDRIHKVRSCHSKFMQTGDLHDANKIPCETDLGSTSAESGKPVFSLFRSQQPQSGCLVYCGHPLA